MQLPPPYSPFGTSTAGESLAESLVESFGLPLLALLIAALGRRVIEGVKFDKWKSSADIAMDATMIGATACGTVFVSPFLEQVLRHTAGYATGAVLLCFVFWVTLLGNKISQPAIMTAKQGRPNLLLGSCGLFLPAFFFLWGFLEYTRKNPAVQQLHERWNVIAPIVSALVISAAGVSATAGILSGVLSLFQRYVRPNDFNKPQDKNAGTTSRNGAQASVKY